MTKLYIVRHGETKWNVESRAQGIENVELSRNGLEQAKILANRLQNHSIGAIYSSDLDRAYMTAKIIGEKKGLPVRKLCELREMSFGMWEGLTIEEIQKKYKEHYVVWRREPHQADIPDGEKLLDVQERGLSAVYKLIKKHEGQNVLIVSHGITIKSIILGLMDIQLSNFYKIKQDNTCLNIVEFRDYGPVIITLNDTAHLESVHK